MATYPPAGYLYEAASNLPDLTLDAATFKMILLEVLVAREITEILDSHRQPSAGELLQHLEGKYEWSIRQAFRSGIRQLGTSRQLKRYDRDYLNSVLSDEEVDAALRGKAKPAQEHKSTVDDLARKSIAYRNSAAFREMIEFVAKFREYAPYNNMLVKIQNPSCGFYATENHWRRKFNRYVVDDAKPMLILAPMHPVMLVYDLDSTDGPPLPDKLTSFAQTEGDFDPKIIERTLDNAERDKILVQFKSLSSTHAGLATTRLSDSNYKMRIVIHGKLDDRSRYSVLCHELAHIYLGHLGTDKDNWWPCRINLTHSTVEIEAEAVSYIVTLRVGLKSRSDSYLSSHLRGDGVPESVSLELISKVAGKLEEMGRHILPARKVKKR